MAYGSPFTPKPGQLPSCPRGHVREVGIVRDPDAALATLDPQAVAIIECTEALANYVEQLHATHGLDQFLTAAECAEVARFIDALGNNPAREHEFFERRTGLILRPRNPEAGWTVETVREAVAQVNNRSDDALPDFARECFVDASVDPMPSKSVALKVTYDAFASLDLSGSVNWQW